MQTQTMQIQSNTKDVDRLEQLMETMRTATTNKPDTEIELHKKLLQLERDLSALTKTHSQDVHDLKQNGKDMELMVKNLRHQIDQGQATNEFKSQEYQANQADSIQNLQLRTDSFERIVRKCQSDLEVSILVSIPYYEYKTDYFLFTFSGLILADERHE